MQNYSNSNKSKIFNDSVYNVLGQVIGYLFLFISTIVFARILCTELFGLFQLGLMTAVFLATLAASFVESTASYFVAYYHNSCEKRNSMIISNLFLSTIIGGLLSIILYTFSLFLLKQVFNIPCENVEVAEIIFKLFAIYLFFFLTATNLKGVLLGLELYRVRAILLIISRSTFLLFGYIGYCITNDVVGIVTGVLTSSILTFVLALIFLHRSIKLDVKLSYRDLRYSTQDIWDYGKRAFFINIGGQVHKWGDTFLIGIFLSTTSVGIYFVAYTLFEGVLQISRSFHEVLYPILTKFAASNDTQKIKLSICNIIRISSVPLYIVTFLIFVFSGDFILILYGYEYILASNVLKILSIIFLSLPLMILTFTMMSINKPEINSRTMIASALLNILLNLYFIPTFGIRGAAVTTLISTVVYYTILCYECKKYISVELPIISLIKSCSLIAIITIIYYLLKCSILVYNIVFASMLISMYIAMLFSIGFFTEYDYKLIRVITGLKLRFLSIGDKK